MIGQKCVDYQSAKHIGQRGGYMRAGARLVLDRTPAPAVYVLSKITRPSEQPVEEGGQKEEAEKKR